MLTYTSTGSEVDEVGNVSRDRMDEDRGLSNPRSSQTTAPKKSTVAWLWLGTAAIALIALTAGLVLRLERQSFVTLQHTYGFVISLLDVLSDVEDAEVRERGYLLTGDSSYLEPLNSSRQVLDKEFERLQELAKSNPQKQEQLERLRYLVQLKLNELQATIDTSAAAGLEADHAIVLTGRGKQLMDAIRQDIRTMVDDEQNSLAQFSQEWQSRLRTSLATLVGSALLAGCCLLIVQIVLARSAARRQRAEEELDASESLFETLCEQAPLGIYKTDAEGYCVYTNRRWSAMSGLSASESLGHGWARMVHPDDRATVFEGWRAAAQQGTAWEYRLLTAHGETLWIRAVAGPIYSARNALTGYVGTLEDVTERKRAERALQESRQELRALAARLINAEEEERKRISRELHDDLSQKLALLAFDTSSLVLALPGSKDELKEPLRNLQTRVVQLAQDVRQISHQLHPTVLEDLGLTAALTELCDEFSAKEGIEVAFEQEAMPKSLPVAIASCLYRIAQEALHNVSKHARASQVRFKLSRSSEGIHLSIRDTGVGFDSDAARFRHGLGIVSMRERVGLVQGEFSIDSQPGWGTEVRIFVPRSKEA
jgi:PAS domain S-box-containing protein